MTSISSSLTSKGTKKKNLELNLRFKMDNLEQKYNEFVNNCSSIIQSPHPQSRCERKLPTERLVEKRGKSNEFFNENAKLKRQNYILSKAVEELNAKVTSLESYKNEHILNKEFEKKYQHKKQMLDKQEKDLIKLKKDLEKSKLETSLIKNNYTEREKSSRGQSQPMKKSKSPISQRFYPKNRDFSPIERTSSISPISQAISPTSRRNHSMKKKLENIQEKLMKTREERDLFKIWQKYCIENPPLPPAVQIIISKYEGEIRKLSTIITILKNNNEKIIRSVKEIITEMSKSSALRSNQTLESLKMKITDLIRDANPIKTIDTKEFTSKSDINYNLLNQSQRMHEKESKDLEDILRREQNRADYFSDELDAKALEIYELKQTLENLTFSDKYNCSSAPISAENFFDSRSVTSIPFNSSLATDFALTAPGSILDSVKLKNIITDMNIFLLSKMEKMSENIIEKHEKFERLQSFFQKFKQEYKDQIIIIKDLRTKQIRILDQNKYLTTDHKKIESELYENLKENEELKRKYKILFEEKELLDQDIHFIREEKYALSEKSYNLEQQMQLYSKAKVLEKRKQMLSIVFEDSALFLPLDQSKIEKKNSDSEIIKILADSFNKEINRTNVKSIINEINEAKSLKSKYLEAMKTYIDLKKDYDDLEQQFEDAKFKNSSAINTELENLISDNKNIKNELKTLMQTNDSLLLENTNLISRLETACKEIESYKASNHKFKQDQEQYYKKNEELEKENHSLKKNVEFIQGQNNKNQVHEVEVLQSYVKNLESLNSSLEKIVATQKIKINKKSDKINELMDINNKYQEDIESLKSNFSEQVMKYENLNQNSKRKLEIYNLPIISYFSIEKISKKSLSICKLDSFIMKPQEIDYHHYKSLSIGKDSSKAYNLMRAESLEEIPEIILDGSSVHNSSNSVTSDSSFKIVPIPVENEEAILLELLEQIQQLIKENVPDIVIE